ncbi:hypothetical protein XENOCAPTIV_010563 [Xenoophorus captivus]|uniref:Uncharacterized protein n=1 Tax=Xenoophorus captivus TaxID=1517983 RepID=A0ABV0Q5K3_9TELE
MCSLFHTLRMHLKYEIYIKYGDQVTVLLMISLRKGTVVLFQQVWVSHFLTVVSCHYYQDTPVGLTGNGQKKISDELQLGGQKYHVDVRGEWADWFEMTERLNKSLVTMKLCRGTISESVTCQTSDQMVHPHIMLPGPVSLQHSDGVNMMKSLIHPALYKRFRLLGECVFRHS